MKTSILTFLATLLFSCAVSASAGELGIVSKEELRGKLNSHEFTILDVRSDEHWNASDNKIPGAIRLPGDKIDIWANNFHKNTQLLLYCACDGLGTSGSLGHKLLAKGFTNVSALRGGWTEWLMNSYPVTAK